MSSDLLKQKALALLKRDKEFHALRQRYTRALGWLQAVDDLSRVSSNCDLNHLLDQWPVVMVRHLNIQCARMFRLNQKNATLALVSESGSVSSNGQRFGLRQISQKLLQQNKSGYFNDPDEHVLQQELGLVRFFWSQAQVKETESYLLVAGYDSSTYSFFSRLDERDQAYYRMMTTKLELLANNLVTIWDLQRLNEDLEEKEVRFRTLFEKIPTGLLIAQPDQKLIHANQTFQDFTGYTANELVGTSLAELTHPDDRRESDRLIEQVCAGVRDGFAMNNRYRRKDGSDFLSKGLVISHRGPKGEVLELFAVIEDVTERQETESKLAGLEQELRHAQKLEALGRLAGGVAHDFNNLLTAIIGNTRFVVDELPIGDTRRADLQEVLRAAGSATELTGQLLSFSRRRVTRTAVFEINKSLRQIHKMLRRTLRETIELALLPSEEPIYVRFSFSQFEQVIFNLAVNAQHAMEEGGVLTIEVSPEKASLSQQATPGDYVRISVTDTGCGMSPKTLEQAFEPFFTTKGEEGTGLGLSTCYGIVKQAGGAINLESRLDRGTTVTLHLPQVPPPVDEPETEAPKNHSTKRRGTVLAVEDQPSILRLMVRALETIGYCVLEARTAEQASALIERDSPNLDMLVTDVVLPGLSGVELRQMLRDKYPNLQVLLTSGYPGDQCESIEDSDVSTSFLAKPFSADQLIGAVSLLSAVQDDQ